MRSLIVVIGAGASVEVGLPDSSALKNQIARLLDIRFDWRTQQSGDAQITRALRKFVSEDKGRGDINAILHVCRKISDAMAQAMSIDSYIDSHAGDSQLALCGKLAIARAIPAAEAASSIVIDESNIYNKLDFERNADTWFHSFFQLLTEGCRLEGIPDRLREIAAIVFNYDRCFEHYLVHALQNYYSVSLDEAARLMDHLDIYHPYGLVGGLPWMEGPDTIGFGKEPNSDQLLAISRQLRTFTEGTDAATSNIDAIRSVLKGAQRIVFLGFAFHSLNIELLFPGADEGKVQGVYATAVGISDNDCRVIATALSERCHLDTDRMQLRNDLTCAALVREYWRSLSLR